MKEKEKENFCEDGSRDSGNKGLAGFLGVFQTGALRIYRSGPGI